MTYRTITRGLLTCLLAGLTFSLSAQSRSTVSGILRDSTNNEAIIGAVIEATPAANPENKKYQTSGYEGKFSLTGLPYGEYTLSISYLGYRTKVVPVKIARSAVGAGTILIAPEAKEIEEVVITGTAMRTSAKGDTLIYNADAFKVSKDAATEDLLAKMPGVTVNNGTVEAHGEQVKKVLVDGKEFFGDDVTTAIKNLPAEVIDRVEVFNKLSDQAEFSGVDDGEGYKALNFVTRNRMDRGSFGKFYAGYGFNDKYNLGGNINLFNSKRRFSIIGMANNVNQQNFATDDILGVMGASTSDGGGQRRGGSGVSNFSVPDRSGVATVYSLGVNYSEKFNEKLKLDASYFFNYTQRETRSFTDRTYYMSETDDQYYEAESEQRRRNYNHRFNAKLDYKINDKNSIMWRPSISFQNNNRDGRDTSHSYTSASNLEKAILNTFGSLSSTHTEGYNISNTLLYMHKFGQKDGRVLTTFLNSSFSKNDSDQDSYSLTQYYNPDSETRLNQQINNRTQGYRLSGHLNYSEPITTKSQLLMSYRISYEDSDRDKRTYDMPGHEFLDEYSNTYNSGYLTQSVGPGYRYRQGKSMLVANVFYQASSLVGDRTFPSPEAHTSARYNNITYMGMLNLQFNPSTTLRTMLRSSTNNPSITQLQDVLDISNPLFITQGNSGLRPVYAHRLYSNFVKANTAKGRTFIASIGGTAQSNYIANSTQRAEYNGYEVLDDQGNVITTLNQGDQYSRPVNLDGYWSANGSLSYGFPVKFIKSNLNVNGGITYTSLPGVFNLVENTTRTTSYLGGATLGSNISERIDFTFGYNVGYNVAKNKERPQSNNEYVNQSATGRFKWVTVWGITLQADAAYYKYTGVTDDFREEYVILNASLGKKLFKGQRGEFNVKVNDLLNQNTSFARTVTDSYIQNVTTNVIGRYVSINFIYNLRRFKGKSVDKIPEGKGGPRMSDGPGGPGGPGGRGGGPGGPPPM